MPFDQLEFFPFEASEVMFVQPARVCLFPDFFLPDPPIESARRSDT
jgi:hypothetical protein